MGEGGVGEGQEVGNLVTVVEALRNEGGEGGGIWLVDGASVGGVDRVPPE